MTKKKKSKKKPDLDILDEVMIQTILSKATPQFEVVAGDTYYLYSRSDGTHFISLVPPEYWDKERFNLTFIVPVTHSPTGWVQAKSTK
tara:strand:+ start:327 stop:590 length:264 start_codon:yes stop_codon:yes gene_type:complete